VSSPHSVLEAATHLEHRGCNLTYRVRGTGPPVLLIQGAGVHGSGWQPQIDELQDRYRCLSFDNRGIGRSQPLGSRLTIEQMADDALALMDAQGWESAHVVGHSMGGPIALQLALTSLTRVKSLSLLCAFGRGRDVTSPSAWMIWMGLRTRCGTRRMRRLAFLEMVMPPAVLARTDRDALAATLAGVFGHDLADQPPVVMKQLSAMRSFDALPRLHELAGIPTLVVSAKWDRIARPALGRALAQAMPGARYLEIDEAAHGVTIQCDRHINDLLAAHFTEAAAAPLG
jgi:pimeloyl-ACP methyl ester carboxylesterase